MKFTFLVKSLKENIDRLYKIIAVENRCQDSEVDKSIKSISSIPNLLIIKAALAKDCRPWSDMASERIRILQGVENRVESGKSRSEREAAPEESQEPTNSRAESTESQTRSALDELRR